MKQIFLNLINQAHGRRQDTGLPDPLLFAACHFISF